MLRRVEITEPTHIPEDVLSMLRGQVVERATLEEVVRWALMRREPFPVVDVIVQDEYTHDVVIRVRGDVYLVFDTT
jgi:hypothetical protein